MKEKLNLFTIVYALVALAEMTGEVLEMRWLIMLTKPMLMTTVILFYFTIVPVGQYAFHQLMVAGFVFSLFGDVALMLLHISEDFFLVGLCAFLLTHILYIVAFFKKARAMPGRSFGMSKLYLALPFLLFYGFLMAILYPVLGELRVPVIIYAAVITLMVVAALNLYGKVSSASFTLIFLGALMFLISDTFIAINKFLTPLSLARILIMSLYIAGQYFIAMGAINIWREENSQPA